jgi:hypothetical protein
LKEKFGEVPPHSKANADEPGPGKPIFVSGTSKFIWFFAPQGWTLFDRLAGHGTNIAKSLPSIERAERFYTALTDRGFEQTIAKAQPIGHRPATNGSFRSWPSRPMIS